MRVSERTRQYRRLFRGGFEATAFWSGAILDAVRGRVDRGSVEEFVMADFDEEFGDGDRVERVSVWRLTALVPPLVLGFVTGYAQVRWRAYRQGR